MTRPRRKRVLFACVGNSCRSQMAEGFARALGADVLEIRSGGSRPAGVVSPNAILAMKERGLDISHQESKGFDIPWVEGCDLVVTMGCGDDACPAFYGKRMLDWDLPDPVGKDLQTFRRVRDEIERRVRALVDEARAGPV